MIVAHQFGAGFSKMKWLGVCIFFLPEWDARPFANLPVPIYIPGPGCSKPD